MYLRPFYGSKEPQLHCTCFLRKLNFCSAAKTCSDLHTCKRYLTSLRAKIFSEVLKVGSMNQQKRCGATWCLRVGLSDMGMANPLHSKHINGKIIYQWRVFCCHHICLLRAQAMLRGQATTLPARHERKNDICQNNM